MTKPSPSPELLRRVRQQLILAQVRIMELEDIRDTLEPQIQDLKKLLEDSRSLTEEKIIEARGLTETVTRCQQLLAEAKEHARQLEQTSESLESRHQKLQADLESQKRAMATAKIETAALRSQLAAIKSTKTWRWTAWLRKHDGP